MGETPRPAPDLEDRFNYHQPPNQRVVDAHQAVRDAMRAAAQVVLDVTPPGREQSLALTKLEEAMFWGNAGIARNHGHYSEPLNHGSNDSES